MIAINDARGHRLTVITEQDQVLIDCDTDEYVLSAGQSDMLALALLLRDGEDAPSDLCDIEGWIGHHDSMVRACERFLSTIPMAAVVDALRNRGLDVSSLEECVHGEEPTRLHCWPDKVYPGRWIYHIAVGGSYIVGRFVSEGVDVLFEDINGVLICSPVYVEGEYFERIG